MENYDLEKIKDLLGSRKWNWAKTYLSVPHEYIVRGKCGLSDEDFLYIVHAQRDLGIHERWGKYNFPYLYVDGYKYWTMGDTFENTIIINRQKVFSEFDKLDGFYDNEYTETQSKEIANFIRETFSKSVFEAGFGFGTFVKDTNILPNDYYGVDASQKAVDFFRTVNRGFYKRVSKKSFEESVDRWRAFDGVVIALFGSASYIMLPYLNILKNECKDYFMMFYKKGYCPESLKAMHHFEYSKQDLENLFKDAFISEYGNYYIVSTKEINIKPYIKSIQNELFPI